MSFDQAILFTLREEGGYVNNPQDPGGETKYGISKHAYPSLDIKNLTENQARDIYYKDYWIKSRCDEMPGDIAISVFDMSVNSGIRSAIRCIQKCLNVADDGICGPLTLYSINNADQEDLFINFNAMRLNFFTTLSNYNVYGKGWFKRVIALSKYVGGLR